MTLAVVDAAAVVDVLCGFPPAGRVGAAMEAASGLATCAHLDAEVFSALTRLQRAGSLPHAEERVRALAELPVERYPLAPLLVAAHALTEGIAARDALYVSLALSLQAQLITTDDRLARAATGIIELA